MRGRIAFSALAIALLLVGSPRPARADEPGDEKARAARFLKIAKEDAASYTVRPEAKGAAKYTLEAEPILKWTNPVVGDVSGGVFLWTSRGRPAAVASIYQWTSPLRHKAHEFHSLTTEPLVAERDGHAAWNPARVGVEFKPIPDAPAPADTAPQRLRQMRDIAKDFSGKQRTREDVDRDMRLLTQPIYRYQPAENQVVDGALFVFVLGTDPEALLLIEDRIVDEKPRWYYASARMNSIDLRVTYRGREAWSVPTIPWSQVFTRDEPYTVIIFEPAEGATAPAKP